MNKKVLSDLSALLALCLFMTCFPLAFAENALELDMTKWQYNTSDDVYWQVGIQYCTNPADPAYEYAGGKDRELNGELHCVDPYDIQVTKT